MVQPLLDIRHILPVTTLGIKRRGDVNLLGRVNPFLPAAGFNPCPQLRQRLVQCLVRQAGQEIRRIVLLDFVRSAKEFLKKWRIDLLAPVVLSADVIHVRAVRQRVLCDDVNIAPVKFLVLFGLLVVRGEAFAKDHVCGAESSGVRAAEQDGVRGHFGIDEVRVGSLHGLFAQPGVVT